MSKGRKLVTNDMLEVYSTKLLAETRQAMTDIVQIVKQQEEDYSQRRLIEDMLQLYAVANPDIIDRTNALRAALGRTPLEFADDLAATAEELASALAIAQAAVKDTPPEPQLPKVKAVKYIGRPQLHLYEPGSKNSTGCGLSGTIDPETIEDVSPDAIDCKKCRYCRKAVFDDVNADA